MKKLFGILLGLCAMVPLGAKAEVKVFACEPEWATLAKEVGRDKVTVFAATTAQQDPHHIRARPSLIAKARQADMLVCSGASLEAGWLPLLLQKAGAVVQPGKHGYLMAAEVVPVLEKPTKVDRSMGDVHPEGNPHVHLNPQNILLMAREISRRLQVLDEANAEVYRKQLADFTTRWQHAMTGWQQAAATLKGKQVVVHHHAFSYLLDWLEMKAVAALEPKPGIPPTTPYLEGLLQQLEKNPAVMIIRTPYEPEKASVWLAEKTSTPAVVLPYTVGGDGQSGDLFALFTRSIQLLKGQPHDQ